MKSKTIIKLSVLTVLMLIIGANIVQAVGTSNDDFDKKILELMEQAKLPSLSIGFITNNSLVCYKGYGKYNLLTGKKPTNETIYAIGSISKSITATAIMQFNETGQIGLDDNVSKYLPFDLKNPNHPDIPITFRMLLAHQSSLFDYDIESLGSLTEKIGLKQTLKMMINILFIPKIFKELYPMIKELLVPGGKIYMPEIWADYPPGKEANYSNLGYAILGYLVELISNQSIEEYCLENIFDPLNMKDTRFHPYEVDRERLAVLYSKWLIRRPIRLPQFDFLCFASAGGIRSTVEDLSHYLIAHMNNGTYKDYCLLNNSTIELMHTIQYPNSSYFPSEIHPEMKFGLGWYYITDKNNDTYGGHDGGGPGIAAFMRVRISDNKGFIIFYNRTGFTDSEIEAVISIIQAIKEKISEI